MSLTHGAWTQEKGFKIDLLPPILPPRQVPEELSLQIGAEIHGQIVLVVFWMCR